MKDIVAQNILKGKLSFSIDAPLSSFKKTNLIKKQHILLGTNTVESTVVLKTPTINAG